MRLDRKEFLQRLLAVSPGIAKQGALPQSDCVVLRRGRFYTLSQEIACSLTSGLTPEIEGAVQISKLLELLKQLPDEKIDVIVLDKILHITGAAQSRKSRIPMEEEILLPIDAVELPKEWTPLHEDFAEAVDLVRSCTKKRGNFLHECVHVHPQWLEASDNTQMARWPIETFVKESVLVRGETLKVASQLGMTKGCETLNWLHFRNPLGLRVSVRKYELEKYPPLGAFLKLRGQKIHLPKSLTEVAKRAGIFSEDESVFVRIKGDEIVVESRCSGGEYGELRKLKSSQGITLGFSVPYKLIGKLVEKSNSIEITEASLRVNGGKYIFASSLEIVK